MTFNIPVSSSVALFSSLLFLIILTITVVLPLKSALGQSSSSSSNNATNTTQQTWVDKLNNLKMQFEYLPKEPIIDKPTELKFTVQNLQTGEQIKNLSARVVVLNNAGGQQRSFKFTNITAPDGIFSVNYLFPDSGQYNVITKIDSKEFTSLTSFNVAVPLPPLSSIVTGGVLSPIVLAEIGIIIAATAAAAVLLWMKRKKETS
ncbi:MAG TPA: hypothetical protein VJ729_00705 [Nitrososphaeraceae archaeon]|nr:hypothetical protein [Nitrososphaeraceae archaeon]